MEIPGHHRGSGDKEEGEGRGLPQGPAGGQQGQAGRPQGPQDRQEARPPPGHHRVLWLQVICEAGHRVYVQQCHLYVRVIYHYNC